MGAGEVQSVTGPAGWRRRRRRSTQLKKREGEREGKC